MISVVDFSDEHRDSFKSLNYEWIEKYFVVEATDVQILSRPKELIIDKGGFIYFAKYEDKIVGTLALINIEDNSFEIAKMAVTEKYQNRGIAKMLLTTAIQKSKEMNKSRIVLYSNTSLSTALNMYFKFGFRVIPKNDFHASRSNIKMQLLLEK